MKDPDTPHDVKLAAKDYSSSTLMHTHPAYKKIKVLLCPQHPKSALDSTTSGAWYF